jgi:hypothetical protein
MNGWIRVTKASPCGACGHSSWCILNPKLGMLICMRQANNRPKTFKDGQVGYLYPLDPNQPALRPVRPEPPPPSINCPALIQKWTKTTRLEQVEELSQQLHVSVASLRALQVCWATEHNAWSIPMYDGHDNMVGIRLRASSGAKWSVAGSHSGPFVPRIKGAATALVCEGFSDTAAGLDLGFFSMGRPAASGGIDQLKQLFQRKGVRRCVVVADNDAVGVSGAKVFADRIGVPNCILVLPTKDLRAFKEAGGDRPLLDSLINQSIWTNV